MPKQATAGESGRQNERGQLAVLGIRERKRKIANSDMEVPVTLPDDQRPANSSAGFVLRLAFLVALLLKSQHLFGSQNICSTTNISFQLCHSRATLISDNKHNKLHRNSNQLQFHVP